MGLALAAFLTIFLLIASAGTLLFYRAGMFRRLSTAISADSTDRTVLKKLKVNNATTSIMTMVQPLGKLAPKSSKEVSVVETRLIRAGYRQSSYVRIFYGAKVAVPVCLCLILFLVGLSSHFGFFVYALAAGLGWLAPDFWLGRRIAKRRLNIQLALPDFLDLMVVCMEAGLSLDQSAARATEELRSAHPEISDELGLVMLEQRAGRPRAEAWKGIADRTDIPIIRTFVSAIVQSDHFGTSLAKTLRTVADTLRVQRRQMIEEQAAKTSVKLVFPLVLCIFPSLFLVTLGPALIVMSDAFKKYLE